MEKSWIDAVRRSTGRGLFSGPHTTADIATAQKPYWMLRLAIGAIEDGNNKDGMTILKENLLPFLEVKVK